DEHSGNELNREHQIPLGGIRIARVRGPESAGDASQKRGKDECAHLGREKIDAHDGGGDLVVSHRLPGASSARARDVGNKESSKSQNNSEQQKIALVCAELYPRNGGGAGEGEIANGRLRYRPALRSTSDGAKVIKQILANKDQGQRHDAQVESLEAQGGRP